MYACSYGCPLDPDKAAITQLCPVHCPDARLKVRGAGAGAVAAGIASAKAIARREVVESILSLGLLEVSQVKRVNNKTLESQTLRA